MSKRKVKNQRRRVATPPGCYNVADYGAVADFDGVTGTDSLPAFKKALAAAKSDLGSSNKMARILVNGHFYLSDTLELNQTVIIDGSGMGTDPISLYDSRSGSGASLNFPGGIDGLRIHSAASLDADKSAEKTIVRNLMIRSKDPIGTNTKGSGVNATVTIFLENVGIENFAMDGITMTGSHLYVGDGNCNGSKLLNCWVGGNGRDGFHLQGADCTGCLISGCVSVVNRRYGFFDHTRMNCYVGCLAEGNAGAGLEPPTEAPIAPAEFGSEYHTEGDGYNTSTFVGCYAEGAYPGHENVFNSVATIIGGTIGANYTSRDSQCFLMESAGRVARSPYVYDNRRGTTVVQATFGEHVAESNMSILKWETSGENLDYTSLRYCDTPGPLYRWWCFENSSIYRHVLRMPTTQANARHPAPWAPNGMFLGREDINLNGPVNHNACPGDPPTTQSSGAPQTYARGDVLWTSEPEIGKPAALICLREGTRGLLNGGLTVGSIEAGSVILIVNDATSLDVGQHLAIAGLDEARKIVAVDGLTITIDVASEHDLTNTRVDFRDAVFGELAIVSERAV